MFVHTCTQTYTYTHKRTYMHIRIYMYRYTDANIQTYVHVHTYTQLHRQTDRQTDTHTQRETDRHTPIHKYTHTHTHNSINSYILTTAQPQTQYTYSTWCFIISSHHLKTSLILNSHRSELSFITTSATYIYACMYNPTQGMATIQRETLTGENVG